MISGDPVMGPVVLATANMNKAAEITAALVDVDIELVPRPSDVPDVDETGTTLLANARLKAEALCVATGLPALADDTGLEIDALGGGPGVSSARFAGPDATDADNVERVLAEMTTARRASRTGRFRTVLVLAWPDGREIVASGVVEGVITDEPHGDHGFGYDPIFRPAGGKGRTFAEMTRAEKQQLSHRGRALRTLAEQLREAARPTS